MGRYVTVDEVRAVCGITTAFISDADFEQLVESAEYEIEKLANTSFTPTTIIEPYQGDGSERLVLWRNPVLKIRALTIDDTSITPEYTRDDKQGGILWLTTEAEVGYFKTKQAKRNIVSVKYDYGVLEATTTQTTSSNAEVAGDSVVIEVASTTGFAADDYVEIEGMDSMREVCKITSVASGVSITVDNLALPHEASSVVTKQTTPYVGLRMMRIGCAMMAVARVVGQSFDEITSYTIGDMSVTKGEPYTQWREVTTQLRKEWNDIWKSFRIRPTIG